VRAAVIKSLSHGSRPRSAAARLGSFARDRLISGDASVRPGVIAAGAAAAALPGPRQPAALKNQRRAIRWPGRDCRCRRTMTTLAGAWRSLQNLRNEMIARSYSIRSAPGRPDCRKAAFQPGNRTGWRSKSGVHADTHSVRGYEVRQATANSLSSEPFGLALPLFGQFPLADEPPASQAID